MRGVLTKVFETHFTVHCDQLNETVIVMADEVDASVREKSSGTASQLKRRMGSGLSHDFGFATSR